MAIFSSVLWSKEVTVVPPMLPKSHRRAAVGSSGRVFGWDEDPWLLLLQPVDRAPRTFLMEGAMEILKRMVSVPLK